MLCGFLQLCLLQIILSSWYWIRFVENHCNSNASSHCFCNKLLLKVHIKIVASCKTADLWGCTWHDWGFFLSPHGVILLTCAVLQSRFCQASSNTQALSVPSSEQRWSSHRLQAIWIALQSLPAVFASPLALPCNPSNSYGTSVTVLGCATNWIENLSLAHHRCVQ